MSDAFRRAAPPSQARRAALAFKGHSGAKLELIEDSTGTFVRKSAIDAVRNTRLREQCLKLRSAYDSGIACPAIYRSGTREGLFYFDMEFIPGETLSHAVISGRNLDWPALLPQIESLLDRFRSTAAGNIPAHAFQTKLRDILDQCRRNCIFGDDVAVVEKLVRQMSGLSWENIPFSECHGDMTFENILIRDDRSLVFLDFDVPEHSSWVLDVGKAFQDIMGHWCLRDLALTQPDGIALLNAQIALSRIEDPFKQAIGQGVPGGIERIPQFSCFHLLRTLPYAKHKDIIGYVLRRISRILYPAI